jgi:hypothetical protein
MSGRMVSFHEPWRKREEVFPQQPEYETFLRILQESKGYPSGDAAVGTGQCCGRPAHPDTAILTHPH